jgi:Tfp pilus assembly protein PilN
MIQLNLLPDVKLEYLKAQRMRRLAMVISFIVTAAAVVILVLMLSVEGFQKHTLGNLNKNIGSNTTKLKKEPQINSVLTVQNQLQSINGLHDSEPAASRLFDYMNELTPTTVNITNLNIDFNAHTVAITGSSVALSAIDQYIDTIKFTNFTTGPNTKDIPAFSSVILSSYSLDNTTAPPASYEITANFDPTIFDITKNITLVIPSKVSTRSDIEHPGPLFVKASSAPTNGGN